MSLWRCIFHQTIRWKGFRPAGRNGELIVLDMSLSDVGTIDTEIGHNLNRPSSLPHSDMEPTQCRNWSLCYDKSVVLSEVHKIYEVTAAEFIFFCFDRHFFADDEFFFISVRSRMDMFPYWINNPTSNCYEFTVCAKSQRNRCAGIQSVLWVTGHPECFLSDGADVVWN